MSTQDEIVELLEKIEATLLLIVFILILILVRFI